MALTNMIGMKRSREDSDPFDGITAMANCLMLLSGAGGDQFQLLSSFTNKHHVNPSRVFECKTCNRQFPSFQALGGHRASHKKPKLGGDLSLQSRVEASPAKAKAHECSVCGQEFAVGQALGGHMRRHRAAAVSEDSNHDHDDRKIQCHQSPVAGKSSNSKTVAGGSKRVWGLDLNLTPSENDYLEFGFGKMVSASPVLLLDRGV